MTGNLWKMTNIQVDCIMHNKKNNFNTVSNYRWSQKPLVMLKLHWPVIQDITHYSIWIEHKMNGSSLFFISWTMTSNTIISVVGITVMMAIKCPEELKEHEVKLYDVLFCIIPWSKTKKNMVFHGIGCAYAKINFMDHVTNSHNSIEFVTNSTWEVHQIRAFVWPV